VTTHAQRLHLHELMALLLEHEPLINYPLHDVRGALDAASFMLSEQEMRHRLVTGKHLMCDCSQAVTMLCKWARLKDPNGLRYRYAGYTGTLLETLPHYTNPKAAKVGALVVYGPGTGEHVSMVYEPGEDPLLWSHGFDGGPVLIRLSAQRKVHHAPVTFCSIAGL
jgi:hypothetical protein